MAQQINSSYTPTPRHVEFFKYDGRFYVLGHAPTLQLTVYQSPVGGPASGTWSELDSSNRPSAETGYPIRDIDSVFVGSKIHVAFISQSGSNWRAEYVEFDLSTGTWGSKVLLQGPFVTALYTGTINIAVRSDGDVLVSYNGPAVSSKGTSYSRVVYSRREGSTWTTGVALDSGGAKYGIAAPPIGIDSNDTCHFCYAWSDPRSLFRTLNSSNSLGTEYQGEVAGSRDGAPRPQSPWTATPIPLLTGRIVVGGSSNYYGWRSSGGSAYPTNTRNSTLASLAYNSSTSFAFTSAFSAAWVSAESKMYILLRKNGAENRTIVTWTSAGGFSEDDTITVSDNTNAYWQYRVWIDGSTLHYVFGKFSAGECYYESYALTAGPKSLAANVTESTIPATTSKLLRRRVLKSTVSEAESVSAHIKKTKLLKATVTESESVSANLVKIGGIKSLVAAVTESESATALLYGKRPLFATVTESESTTASLHKTRILSANVTESESTTAVLSKEGVPKALSASVTEAVLTTGTKIRFMKKVAYSGATSGSYYFQLSPTEWEARGAQWDICGTRYNTWNAYHTFTGAGDIYILGYTKQVAETIFFQGAQFTSFLFTGLESYLESLTIQNAVDYVSINLSSFSILETLKFSSVKFTEIVLPTAPGALSTLWIQNCNEVSGARDLSAYTGLTELVFGSNSPYSNLTLPASAPIVTLTLRGLSFALGTFDVSPWYTTLNNLDLRNSGLSVLTLGTNHTALTGSLLLGNEGFGSYLNTIGSGTTLDLSKFVNANSITLNNLGFTGITLPTSTLLIQLSIVGTSSLGSLDVSGCRSYLMNVDANASAIPQDDINDLIYQLTFSTHPSVGYLDIRNTVDPSGTAKDDIATLVAAGWNVLYDRLVSYIESAILESETISYAGLQGYHEIAPAFTASATGAGSGTGISLISISFASSALAYATGNTGADVAPVLTSSATGSASAKGLSAPTPAFSSSSTASLSATTPALISVALASSAAALASGYEYGDVVITLSSSSTALLSGTARSAVTIALTSSSAGMLSGSSIGVITVTLSSSATALATGSQWTGSFITFPAPPSTDYLRPDGDISSTGMSTTGASYYTEIDEETADTNDYVSNTSGANGQLIVSLSNPSTGTLDYIVARIYTGLLVTLGNDSLNIYVAIVDSSGTLKTDEVLISSKTNLGQLSATLTNPDTNFDYANARLRLRYAYTIQGQNDNGRIATYQLYVEYVRVSAETGGYKGYATGLALITAYNGKSVFPTFSASATANATGTASSAYTDIAPIFSASSAGSASATARTLIAPQLSSSASAFALASHAGIVVVSLSSSASAVLLATAKSAISATFIGSSSGNLFATARRVISVEFIAASTGALSGNSIACPVPLFSSASTGLASANGVSVLSITLASSATASLSANSFAALQIAFNASATSSATASSRSIVAAEFIAAATAMLYAETSISVSPVFSSSANANLSALSYSIVSATLVATATATVSNAKAYTVIAVDLTGAATALCASTARSIVAPVFISSATALLSAVGASLISPEFQSSSTGSALINSISCLQIDFSGSATSTLTGAGVSCLSIEYVAQADGAALGTALSLIQISLAGSSSSFVTGNALSVVSASFTGFASCYLLGSSYAEVSITFESAANATAVGNALIPVSVSLSSSATGLATGSALSIVAPLFTASSTSLATGKSIACPSPIFVVSADGTLSGVLGYENISVALSSIATSIASNPRTLIPISFAFTSSSTATAYATHKGRIRCNFIASARGEATLYSFRRVVISFSSLATGTGAAYASHSIAVSFSASASGGAAARTYAYPAPVFAATALASTNATSRQCISPYLHALASGVAVASHAGVVAAHFIAYATALGPSISYSRIYGAAFGSSADANLLAESYHKIEVSFSGYAVGVLIPTTYSDIIVSLAATSSGSLTGKALSVIGVQLFSSATVNLAGHAYLPLIASFTGSADSNLFGSTYARIVISLTESAHAITTASSSSALHPTFYGQAFGHLGAITFAYVLPQLSAQATGVALSKSLSIFEVSLTSSSTALCAAGSWYSYSINYSGVANGSAEIAPFNGVFRNVKFVSTSSANMIALSRRVISFALLSRATGITHSIARSLLDANFESSSVGTGIGYAFGVILPLFNGLSSSFVAGVGRSVVGPSFGSLAYVTASGLGLSRVVISFEEIADGTLGWQRVRIPEDNQYVFASVSRSFVFGNEQRQYSISTEEREYEFDAIERKLLISSPTRTIRKNG